MRTSASSGIGLVASPWRQPAVRTAAKAIAESSWAASDEQRDPGEVRQVGDQLPDHGGDIG